MPLRLRVTNLTRRTLLADRAVLAANPWSRLVGLLGHKSLAAGEGLLLRGEQAIHTFGMRFAIDVIYLDADRRVLYAQPAMPPSRLGPFLRNAHDVLELPSGTLDATRTRVGDDLAIEFTS